MIERAYTVREIDELRIAVKNATLPYLRPGECRRIQAVSDSVIEDRMRTYMLAGVSADDVTTEYMLRQEEYVRRTQQSDMERLGKTDVAG